MGVDGGDDSELESRVDGVETLLSHGNLKINKVVLITWLLITRDASQSAG